jgi:hypothetical protein
MRLHIQRILIGSQVCLSDNFLNASIQSRYGKKSFTTQFNLYIGGSKSHARARDPSSLPMSSTVFKLKVNMRSLLFTSQAISSTKGD